MANWPGKLARLFQTLGAGRINLVVSGLAQDVSGLVAFIADDEPAARAVLRVAELDYAERLSLTVRLANVPAAAATLPGPGRGEREHQGVSPGPDLR